jgi:hypothetical protein
VQQNSTWAQRMGYLVCSVARVERTLLSAAFEVEFDL